jgi:hypothetical protein
MHRRGVIALPGFLVGWRISDGIGDALSHFLLEPGGVGKMPLLTTISRQ